jgi:hypothetical protein
VQFFYDGLISNDKKFLDATVGGALTNKNANEAYNLIETMLVNQHHWSHFRPPSNNEHSRYA